nr:hypothetical protein [Tanacetum cinerariifolium]
EAAAEAEFADRGPGAVCMGVLHGVASVHTCLGGGVCSLTLLLGSGVCGLTDPKVSGECVFSSVPEGF